MLMPMPTQTPGDSATDIPELCSSGLKRVYESHEDKTYRESLYFPVLFFMTDFEIFGKFSNSGSNYFYWSSDDKILESQ